MKIPELKFDTKVFRPMLAMKEPRWEYKRLFPALISPKIDGIRGTVLRAKLCSRTRKPFPNKFVMEDFSHAVLHGFDGELVSGEVNVQGVMERTKSAVSTIEGIPQVDFWVFDDFSDPKLDFVDRYASLQERVAAIGHPRIKVVPQWRVENRAQVDAAEAYLLEQGFEGVMLRTFHGEYMFGRSRAQKPWLAKIKKFTDDEATVVGYFEEMENTNPQEVNELGLSTRSHESAGMVGKGRLGGFILNKQDGSADFRCGSGFTEDQRIQFWAYREEAIGQIVKFKHFEYGAVNAPRHPVFLGFRMQEDM